MVSSFFVVCVVVIVVIMVVFIEFLQNVIELLNCVGFCYNLNVFLDIKEYFMIV